MTIPPDIEAQILRYYHAERWRVGTIAKQLRVHRDTVTRVLAQAGLPHIERLRRPSKIDGITRDDLENRHDYEGVAANSIGTCQDGAYRTPYGPHHPLDGGRCPRRAPRLLP